MMAMALLDWRRGQLEMRSLYIRAYSILLAKANKAKGMVEESLQTVAAALWAGCGQVAMLMTMAHRRL